MTIDKFSPDNRITINWAHGTSTELFIHPGNANFLDRNFTFRISTATVEAEETNFTYFEGITRHLMILKGEVDLAHEGRYSKHLKPFDQDIFSGEWNTTSRGKVTDFNLMLKENAIGSLLHIQVQGGESTRISTSGTFCFVYIANGKVTDHNGELYKTGDLLKIQNDLHETLELKAQEKADLIRISVSVR